MKRLQGLWPALLALAAFSFSATLWASSGLGTADAERQWASPALPLSVYARNEPGAPALGGEAVKAWGTTPGVACALPVAEIPAAMSGYGYSAELVACAVPEEKLAAAGMAFASGRLPGSAWEPELLLGYKAAETLAAEAAKAGLSMPSRAKLTLHGAGAGKSAAPAMDALISGVAAPTGTAMDDAVWVDIGTLRAFMDAHAAFFQDAGISLDPIRCDVYMEDVDAMDALAGQLEAQGYLVVDPLAEQALTLQEGRAMARQWAALSALCGLAALLASWRWLRRADLIAIPAAAAATAAGMLLAAGLIQPAMLLGWRFLVSGRARYLLDAPWLIAIFASGVAIGLSLYFLPRQAGDKVFTLF